MRVYVVGGNKFRHYALWLPNVEIVEKIENSDLVLFCGGEDVDPSLYEEPKNKKTLSNLNRDMQEAKIFYKAVDLEKPILGICRGSQFSCVMSGGRLVQHQDNPSFIHTILLKDGERLEISSTHHQAQYPYDLPDEDYELLAWTEGESTVHEDGNGDEISHIPFKEAEIVYYRRPKALGIQGHPEMMKEAHYKETFEYLRGLVTKLVNNDL